MLTAGSASTSLAAAAAWRVSIFGLMWRLAYRQEALDAPYSMGYGYGYGYITGPVPATLTTFSCERVMRAYALPPSFMVRHLAADVLRGFDPPLMVLAWF